MKAAAEARLEGIVLDKTASTTFLNLGWSYGIPDIEFEVGDEVLLWEGSRISFVLL